MNEVWILEEREDIIGVFSSYDEAVSLIEERWKNMFIEEKSHHTYLVYPRWEPFADFPQHYYVLSPYKIDTFRS